MSGLFVMDNEEINRITKGVEPLSDFYPKRLTDMHPDLKAAYQFGRNYFETSGALRRFLSRSRDAIYFGDVGEQLVGRSRSLSTSHPAANAGFGCSE